MPERRGFMTRLLAPFELAAGRRLAVAGVAGIMLTAPLSLEQAINPRLAVGWVLTLLGAALAIACCLDAWTPPAWLARAATFICLVFCVATAALGVSQTIASLATDDQQLSCGDDVGPDTIIGGQQLLAGINPFTNFNVLTAERQLGCPQLKVTPLRAGSFASNVSPPNNVAIQAAAESALAGHPDPGLLVSFNYPAGTAFTGILGPHGLTVISPLAMLFAVVAVVRRMPAGLRRASALALGAQTGALAMVGVVRPDAIVAALLIIACTQRRSLYGGLALGLACATKQTAWFIAPALLALAWREEKSDGLRYATGTLIGFAVVNAVFIVATPTAWLHDVLGPQTSPEFPFGMGPAAFFGSGPSYPPALAALTALMLLAVAGGTAMCLFAPRRWAAAGVIVASLGLWVGPRSLGFYVALLGLIAVSTVAGSEAARAGVTRSLRYTRTVWSQKAKTSGTITSTL
jgi:hypothetical protein